MDNSVTAVVLAAGKGTRMKSERAKVLHEVFFKPMLHHVLDSIKAAGIDRTAVIVGHQRQAVLASLEPYDIIPVIQEEQLGTGHAVRCAREACQATDLVMILCGDTPLIRPETLQAMLRFHQQSEATLTLMTTLLEDPSGYGRVVCQGDAVVEIVEQKDCSPEQRCIREVNAGIYLVDRSFLFEALGQVTTDNAQGEVYLTDIVSIGCRKGVRVGKYTHPHSMDVLGVNSRVELAQAHAVLQERYNRQLMLAGVTMYGPETILVAPDCTVGRDTVICAGVQITGHSRIGAGCLLETGAVLSNCQVADQAVVGAHAVLHNCQIESAEHIVPLTYRVG